MTTTPRMPLFEALQVLHEVRNDQIVVTTMGPAREWQKLPEHPLDFCHIPSCMGHTSAIGLGLAMARPHSEVFVLNADGSMLMSLGNLVTITAQRPANLTLIVCDNSMYEVTGRQLTPGGLIDFCGLAAAAGFATVARFDALETWRAEVADVLTRPGPRFVHLLVEPVEEQGSLQVPVVEPMAQQVGRFRRALGADA